MQQTSFPSGFGEHIQAHGAGLRLGYVAVCYGVTHIFNDSSIQTKRFHRSGLLWPKLLPVTFVLKSWSKIFHPRSFFFWDKLCLLWDDLSKLLSHNFLSVQVLVPQDFCLPQKYLLRYKISQWVPALAWQVLGISSVF